MTQLEIYAGATFLLRNYMRTLERRTGRRTQTTLLNHQSNYPDVERHEIDPKGNAMDRFKEPLNRSLDRFSLEEYDF
jgi:hypothetical protein